MSEWEKLEAYDLGRIANALEEIVCLLKKLSQPPQPPPATGGKIEQIR